MYKRSILNRWNGTSRSLALAALLLGATACGGVAESSVRPPPGAGSGGKGAHGGGAGASGASAGGGGTGGAQPDCLETSSSDLPGVSLDLEDRPCSYTLAELEGGVDLAYAIRVEEPPAGVGPVSMDYSALCVEPLDRSRLVVFEELRRDGVLYYYWECDMGRCVGHPPEVGLEPGEYPRSLPWDGKSRRGSPAQCFQPGEPVPPGSYELVLRAAGTWTPPGASGPREFTVETRRGITVTP